MMVLMGLCAGGGIEDLLGLWVMEVCGGGIGNLAGVWGGGGGWRRWIFSGNLRGVGGEIGDLVGPWDV